MAPTLPALMQAFLALDSSDLYLTAEAPPMARTGDAMQPLADAALTDSDIIQLATELVGANAMAEFEARSEYDTAVDWQGRARLRINLFRQRQHIALVARRIHTRIPSLGELNLPEAYTQLAMEKRGLVLVTGGTGSGKTTSLAAMIGHRNTHSSGHIITIEDPIEFAHAHKGCLVTQRDIGIDTPSYEAALRSAMRQRPDVIMIGEIRDGDAMEHAISFAETGHLVLATLHASNAGQAVERILHFFPEEKRRQLLLNLSLNLRGILSQRLIAGYKNRRVLAVEIMLNQGQIRPLIFDGKVRELKQIIEKSNDMGMQSFDQALYALWLADELTDEAALAEADNPANLRLLFKQRELQRKMGNI